VNLQNVLDRFLQETEVIETSFGSCGQQNLAGLDSYQSSPLEDGCLVSLWDAWGRFLREAVLACTFGPTTGLSGATYEPVAPRNVQEVLAHLQSHGFNGSFAEPTWHSTQVLSSVIRSLQVPNGSTIMNGVGVVSIVLGAGSIANPLQELRACRNFVAHKTDETHKKLRRFGAHAQPDLRSHLRSRRQGVEHFVDLIDGTRGVAAAVLN
jgi:hypothetical protein